MGQKNSNDNNEHKMRDHYEVLEVPSTATLDDIKKAYKKAALKWHPDRNHGQEELATEMFKEVSAAYNVLSDPHERKWYDDHKSSILRGGHTDNNDENNIKIDISSLWNYFSHTCYSGDDDGPSGFFTIYRSVFERLIEEENNEYGTSVSYPPFGDSSTNSKDVLKFYSHWSNFVTVLSFAWEDQYDARDAPNRDTRRAIDKENKKFRDKARKEYNELVRSLASYIRKRDPRIKAIEEESKRLKDEAEERRKVQKLEKQEEKKILREKAKLASGADEEEINRRIEERKGAYLLADDDSDEEVDSESGDIEENEAILQQKLEIKRSQKKYNMNDDDDDDDDDEKNEDDEDKEHCCEICNKIFKTSQQLTQHNSSKVHRQAVKDFEKKNKNKNKKSILKKSVESVEEGSDDDNTNNNDNNNNNNNNNNEQTNDTIFTSLNDMNISKKNPLACEFCGYEAKSRNMLFQHIEETGHAMIKNTINELTNDNDNTKKKKKKLKL